MNLKIFYQSIQFLVLASVITPASAAEVKPSNFLNVNFIQQAFAGLKSISSISFSSEQTTTVTKSGDTFKTYLTYTASGKKYIYTSFQDTNNTGSDEHYTVGYDGTTCNYYTARDGMMSVATHRMDDVPLINNWAFFEPFSFFGSKDATSGPYVRFPSLTDFQNSDLLKSEVKQFTDIKEVQYEGHNCVSLRVAGGRIPFRTEDSEFTVYFDKDIGFYPIAWERVGKETRQRIRYFVTEIGYVKLGDKKIAYPKSAIRTLYLAADPDHPFTITKSSIREINLNEVSEDFDFQIDPTIANVIFDADAKKYITVPH